MSHSPAALCGNIRHSVVSWPFQVFGEQWDLDTLCRTARELGAVSVELVDPDGWPTLAKYGLTCAIAPNGMPGEPFVKLLFDIYHIQVMDGDLIRRIREFGPALIGHVHTAGTPGRGELDEHQEIHYPAVMRALTDSGYRGYVGHEFIPTHDPREGIAQAIAVCDV